jgi:hypothetical protein
MKTATMTPSTPAATPKTEPTSFTTMPRAPEQELQHASDEAEGKQHQSGHDTEKGEQEEERNQHDGREREQCDDQSFEHVDVVGARGVRARPPS